MTLEIQNLHVRTEDREILHGVDLTVKRGETKRAEILQLAMLQPAFAVLDETDSGLDIDALNTVAKGVNTIAEGSDMGVLIITHYTRILGYVRPDFVHIMLDGRIVTEGGSELADELEEKGYEFVREEVAARGA